MLALLAYPSHGCSFAYLIPPTSTAKNRIFTKKGGNCANCLTKVVFIIPFFNIFKSLLRITNLYKICNNCGISSSTSESFTILIGKAGFVVQKLQKTALPHTNYTIWTHNDLIYTLHSQVR